MAVHLDLVFTALADPTRRSILTMLSEDDMSVTDLADPFDMSLAAISKHLSVLVNAGLVIQEKRGRIKWCRLNTDGLHEASVWIAHFGLVEYADFERVEAWLHRCGLADDGVTDDAEINQ